MKHRALFAFLLSSRQGSVSRACIRELLWGSRSDGQARASLRGVLSEIRGALKPHSPLPIAADRNQVYLTDAPLAVDVIQLHYAIRATSVETLQSAADLYLGDFLSTVHVKEEMFEEWKASERFRLGKTYSRVLTKLLSALWESEDPPAERIEDVANQLLGINAADEDAHRALMLLYTQQGKQLLAVEQFRTCEQRLRSVDALPSNETINLYEKIKAATVADGGSPPDTGFASTSQADSYTFGTSIAVTPFVSVDVGDEGTLYGELIAEEIIAAATRFKWFRVVPRSESFNHQVVGNGSLAVARETGAKYVLEGRLRRTDSGYMLSVELIDCVRSNTVWTDRLYIAGGVFADRDEVVAKVACRLDEQLRVSEMSHARQQDPYALSSYECTLLAISNMYDMKRASYDSAERLFNMAAKRKPDHSSTYSFWSLWKMWCVGQGWSGGKNPELIDAGDLARKAIGRDPSDAMALAISGHYESFWNKDFEQGTIQLDKSLSNNPYSSFAWMLSSATCSYRGMAEEALTRLDHTETLCSITPPLEFMYSMARCVAHNFNRDFEQAKTWGQRVVSLNGGFTNGYKHLLVAVGHLEQKEDCQRYLDKLLELDPEFSVGSFMGQYPILRKQDREIFLDGLTKAVSVTTGNASRPSLSVVDNR